MTIPNSLVLGLVTAPSGLSTGWLSASNNVVEQISQSAYFSDGLEDDTTGQLDTNILHQVIIYQPADGDYRLVLSGANGAAYDIETATYSALGQLQVRRLWTGTLGAGGRVTASTSVASTAPGFGNLAGSITNGSFELIFTGTTGTTNVVETSQDLANWSALVHLVNTNGFLRYQDPVAVGVYKKCYRVRIIGH